MNGNSEIVDNSFAQNKNIDGIKLQIFSSKIFIFDFHGTIFSTFATQIRHEETERIIWLVCVFTQGTNNFRCLPKNLDNQFYNSLHTVLYRLYIENQKYISNFWINDVFLIDKQLFIWRIVQNRSSFL